MKNIACLLAAIGFFPNLRGATVDYAASNADTIVIGTVTNRTEASRSVTFEISVEQVLSGTGSAGQTLQAVHTWQRQLTVAGLPDPTPLSETVHGIWCLKKTSSSAWEVLPVNGPDGFFRSLYWQAPTTIPASYQTVSNTLANPSLSDRLAIRIAAGAEEGGNPDALFSALSSSQAAPRYALFRHYASHPLVGFKIVGIAGMLENQDIEALTLLQNAWPMINSDAQSFRVVMALRESFRSPDPVTIKKLTAWTSTVSGDIRSAGVRALSSIHTVEALPFLGNLLASSDPEERAQAVFGLAAFANACPIQNVENTVSMQYLQCAESRYSSPETKANFAFRRSTPEQEASLVSFWTEWWNSHPELH